MYIISEIDMTSVIAIVIDIWSDRHAGILRFCIVFTVLYALVVRPHSLTTAAILVFASCDIWAHRH